MAFTHCGLVTPWFYRSWLSSQCVLPDSILPHIMMQLPTHDITPPISCIEYILYWRTVFHSINCFIPGTSHVSWFSKCRMKIKKRHRAQCSARRYFGYNYQGCLLWVPMTWQSNVFKAFLINFIPKIIRWMVEAAYYTYLFLILVHLHIKKGKRLRFIRPWVCGPNP